MTTALQLISKLPRLSEDQQRDVLAYVEKLESASAKPKVNPQGICAGLRSDLPWDEFQRNRQEMWGEASTTEL
jgi:hypothetical protein